MHIGMKHLITQVLESPPQPLFSAAAFTDCTPVRVILRHASRVPAGIGKAWENPHMTRWISRFLFMLPILFLAAALAPKAMAGDFGTPDEAKAMALRAADLLRSKGPAVAFPEFDKATAFHDRDLYVMVYNRSGTCVAHGANPALIGKTLINLQDTNGKYLIKDLVGVTDAGWIDYTWPNPVTKKIQPKVTYVVRVGDFQIGVGAYK